MLVQALELRDGVFSITSGVEGITDMAAHREEAWKNAGVVDVGSPFRKLVLPSGLVLGLGGLLLHIDSQVVVEDNRLRDEGDQ